MCYIYTKYVIIYLKKQFNISYLYLKIWSQLKFFFRIFEYPYTVNSIWNCIHKHKVVVCTACVRGRLNCVALAWTWIIFVCTWTSNTIRNCNKVQTNSISEPSKRYLLNTMRTSIANSGAFCIRYFYVVLRSRSHYGISSTARITGSLTCNVSCTNTLNYALNFCNP